jgi:CRP-like cAMP-binding protein
MQRSGDVPSVMSFVVNGRVQLMVTGRDGALIPVSTLNEGDFIGQTALTREPVTGGAYAVGEVTMLQIDRKVLEQFVFQKPELLQDLSQAIDERRERARLVATQAKDHSADVDSTPEIGSELS